MLQNYPNNRTKIRDVKLVIFTWQGLQFVNLTFDVEDDNDIEEICLILEDPGNDQEKMPP